MHCAGCRCAVAVRPCCNKYIIVCFEYSFILSGPMEQSSMAVYCYITIFVFKSALQTSEDDLKLFSFPRLSILTVNCDSS